MKNRLIKIGLIVFLVLALTISAFAEKKDKGLFGVYDLTGYNSDALNSAMASYNTFPAICVYMESHFTGKNHSAAWSPYKFYTRQWGDCNDYSTYALYCLYKCAGLPLTALRQAYVVHTDGTSHTLALCKGYGGYSYSSNYEYYGSVGSFDEVIQHYVTYVTPKTVNYVKVYDYDLDYLGIRYY